MKLMRLDRLFLADSARNIVWRGQRTKKLMSRLVGGSSAFVYGL